MGGHEGFGLMGAGLMWVFWIALIVLLVVIVSASVANGSKRNDNAADRPSALDILKQRYARGEIDQDEFERRHRDLLG